jgi:DNA mismatch repair protein MutS2
VTSAFGFSGVSGGGGGAIFCGATGAGSTSVVLAHANSTVASDSAIGVHRREMDAMDRLEFAAIKKALAARVRTSLGAGVVDALAPLSEIGIAKERIEAIRQARILLEKGEPPPVWGAHDVEKSLELGEKGIMLESASLRAIAHTMTTGSALRKHLLAHEHEAPALYGMAAGLTDLSRVANQVLHCFEPDGTLADHASKDLGHLRQHVRDLREMIHEKLSELVHSDKMQPLLQETYFTVRADRYVLPVKASYKNEVEGIVHDASGSGQTVFIEPQVLVDLGNRLKIAQSAQVEEEHRILSSLTRLVVRDAEMVRRMMEVIGRCDFLSGAARLALDLDLVPLIPDEVPGFELLRARHPLLLLQAFVTEEEGVETISAQKQREVRVVPNDLALGGGRQVLVVTGPNTGGKTVAMKTIGLIALMVRCGLHVPCADTSRIGWYRSIEVAIGDQQSIASNLSTFAAHVKAIVRILDKADASTLVLIDEIAADTDPTQGAALAQAVLERLADTKAHAVVTTHFERLKAVPFADQRFRNAGVGFDPKALKPTYRVTLDVPQGSSGFDIAQSLGLDPAIVGRAREILGRGAGELEKVMKVLEQRSSELEDARERAEKAAAAADLEREGLVKKRQELEAEIKELRTKAREDLLREIASTRDEVRLLIAGIREQGDAAKEMMRAANAASEKLAEIEKAEQAKSEASRPSEKPVGEIAVGDWVHVARLGRDGDVVALDGKDVHVVVGNMRMRLNRNEVLPSKTRRPKKTARPEPKEIGKALRDAHQPAGPTQIVEEIDVRGMTVDECIERLEAFLDHHYGRPTTHVRIIHGLGTGALREGIREHLARSGYVKSVRPGEAGEGGDGVTVVTLA